MWKLSLQNSQRTLAESAIIRRNPAAANMHTRISAGDRQKRAQHQYMSLPTPAFSRRCRLPRTGLRRVNSDFHLKRLTQRRSILDLRSSRRLNHSIAHRASSDVSRNFASLLS